MDEFIEQVAKEMAAQGISQRELARRLQCSQPYLSRVLHKQQNPTMEWAEKLATELGLRLSVKKIRFNPLTSDIQSDILTRVGQVMADTGFLLG